jgi:iron-sulfur cluster insertion protein
MITLTPTAVEALQSVLLENEMPDAALRLWVTAASCSQVQVNLALDQGPFEEDDTIFAQGESRVVVDGVSVGYLSNAEIDWLVEDGHSGFVVNVSSSGCCGQTGEGCHCSRSQEN